MATVHLSQSDLQICSPSIRLLTVLPGSSLLAVHAYHLLPTDTHNKWHIPGSALTKKPRRHTTSYYKKVPLSWETFQREPATRQFVWSFATMHIFRRRVARQTGSGPPVPFRNPSAHTHIVHCLSGPTNTSSPSRISMHSWSPWSVFQDG